MVAEKARLDYDALPTTARTHMEPGADRITGGDMHSVVFACVGQVNEIGCSEVAADDEQTLVL